MARSRASAKKAGSAFERLVADYLAAHLDDRIDRRVKTGALDKGDIGGVRTYRGAKVVIEAKNTVRMDLAGWIKEAEAERVNDGAAIGVVVSKRHGVGEASEQYVHMTLATFTNLLNGA